MRTCSLGSSFRKMPCEFSLSVRWAEERAGAGSPRRAWSPQLRAALLWLLSSLLGKAVCGLTGIKEMWVLSPLCSDYLPKTIHSLGAVVQPHCSLLLWNICTHLEFLKADSQPVCLQLPALQALYSVKISDGFLHL